MASTIGGILNTARTALLAQQRATQVTAHNISNATTEGYSRQRADMVAGTPISTPFGPVGTGVHVVDVERARDALLDRSFRRESSLASGHRMRYDLLGLVETRFGEPGDYGLGAALDAFWSSWADLANDPTNTSARTAVQSRGRQLAEQLNGLAAGLDEVRDVATARLGGTVGRLNDLSSAVADLNRRIVAEEAGGHTASDLRDERDRILDEMATLVSIEVHERENGSVGVIAGGVGIVDGVRVSKLQAHFSGDDWSLRLESGTTLDVRGGELAGMLQVLNTDLPALEDRLDELARGIVHTVNDLHRTGTNPLGQTDVVFFDDQGGDLSLVTARNIALSDDVAADASSIAAGSGGAAGEYRSGASDIALALAQLRDTPETDYLGGRTFGDFHANLVQDLGLSIRSTGDAATVHETLAANAEARRLSVSGVQTDEELIRLMQFQSAYTAAARVVTAADEMLQSLLNMV